MLFLKILNLQYFSSYHPRLKKLKNSKTAAPWSHSKKQKQTNKKIVTRFQQRKLRKKTSIPTNHLRSPLSVLL